MNAIIRHSLQVLLLFLKISFFGVRDFVSRQNKPKLHTKILKEKWSKKRNFHNLLQKNKFCCVIYSIVISQSPLSWTSEFRYHSHEVLLNSYQMVHYKLVIVTLAWAYFENIRIISSSWLNLAKKQRTQKS